MYETRTNVDEVKSVHKVVLHSILFIYTIGEMAGWLESMLQKKHLFSLRKVSTAAVPLIRTLHIKNNTLVLRIEIKRELR